MREYVSQQMNELLTVEGITKLFNNQPALDDVSFSVRPGEVSGLIGQLVKPSRR